jgi:hypothetical protein
MNKLRGGGRGNERTVAAMLLLQLIDGQHIYLVEQLVQRTIANIISLVPSPFPAY